MDNRIRGGTNSLHCEKTRPVPSGRPIALSEALHTPLQGLELALRNRIHTVMSESRSPHWFQDSTVICLEKQQKQVGRAFDDLIRQKKQPSPGGVVAALTFKFWTSMLCPEYEDLWRSTLYTIGTKPGERT
jgi:hypothetical protein